MGNVRPAVEGSVMICYSCFKLGMLASVLCCLYCAVFIKLQQPFSRPPLLFLLETMLHSPAWLSTSRSSCSYLLNNACMHACIQMFFLKDNLCLILLFLARLCIMDSKTLVDIIFSLGFDKPECWLENFVQFNMVNSPCAHALCIFSSFRVWTSSSSSSYNRFLHNVRSMIHGLSLTSWLSEGQLFNLVPLLRLPQIGLRRTRSSLRWQQHLPRT